jgi:4-hydroxy-2-oxoglutarate aldolase
VTKTLQGILAPVVTTFDTRGELAPEAFVRNLRAHLGAGLAGVLVAGSTGEGPLLTEGERTRLVELARTEVPTERWLIAGIGAESTALTVRRACEAAVRGADAVLVLPPHYYGAAMTDEALLVHYRRVADESPCPVLLYNIRRFTHLALPPAVVGALAEHENVAGMKDSDGDMERFELYLRAQSDRFVVLTGHAGTLQAALERGARGAVLAVSLFAAPLVLELSEAVASGDRRTAADAQSRLALLGREVAATLGIAGIKAALDQVGLDGGAVRPPLLPSDAEARARVATLLQAASVPVAA